MSDEIPRRGLLNGFLARLPSLSYGEARILDVCLTTIEMIRAGGDRQWQRRIATGPGDVDRSWHLARYQPLSGRVSTLCSGSWHRGDSAEGATNPPLEERCHACWRAACGGSAIGMALLDVVEQLAIQDRDTAALREAARDEMVPPWPATKRWLDYEAEQACRRASPDVRIVTASSGPGGPYLLEPIDPPITAVGTDRLGFDPASEFAVDQQLTRLDPTPSVIALCEQGRDRDEDLELEWDVSDIHAGEGR